MLERLDEIFERAVALQGEDRARYLAEASAGDASLRAELDSLLEAHDRQGAFLADPSADVLPPSSAVSGQERAGQRIGRYKLREPIGEGGFGTVWLAEQRDPVKREVALKIIKLGMDTRQVVARFEAERQALALLDHPNIAKVHDAGSTETGRPYFVMEYISGVPILEYCDREKIDTKTRLELFVQVCRAIQHAHQKGIIHRDIKPGNVLVARHDGQPVPKVIDFGIAKATGGELTTQTVYTELRQMIGTPIYMSPEQADRGGHDIDTRTDVYSLGVLLYELLTGSTPFRAEELHAAGHAEMMRIIRDVDPPKPSTRLDDSKDIIATVAATRRAEPRKLTGLVRGELDWIVMKALEKQRDRRYDSANGFAHDVERFLGGDPVLAAPPSQTYLARKFIRRHKGTVLAACLVGLSLLAGMIAFAVQARLTEQERVIAGRERNHAVAAEEVAEQRAQDLQKVTEFHVRMLDRLRPMTLGRNLRTDVLERSNAALERAGIPDAERAAQQEDFIAHWERINATDVAMEFLDQALLRPAQATLRTQYKEQPLVAAHLQQSLATVHRTFGDLREARVLQEAALEARRELLDPDHPDLLKSMGAMGTLLQREGQWVEARDQWEEVLSARRRAHGDGDSATVSAKLRLAYLESALWRLDEAEALSREAAADRSREFGPTDPRALSALFEWAEALRMQRRFREAIPVYREVLAGRVAVFGQDHTQPVLTQFRLASALTALGEAEGEALMEQTLQLYDRAVSEDRAGLRTDFNSSGGLSRRFGDAFRDAGDLARAEVYYRDALEKCERAVGLKHELTIHALTDMGAVLLELGRAEEAEPFLQRAVDLSQEWLEKENTSARSARRALGRLLLVQGQLDEAERIAKEVLDLDRSLLASDHRWIAAGLADLAEARQQLGKERAALAGFEQAVPMQRRLNPDGSPRLARLLFRSARCHLEAGDPSKASREIEEALEIGERLLPATHPDLAEFRKLREAAK